jgi:molybdate transport system substrate-binding protein
MANDMIIMSNPSIDAQIKAGKVVAGSRVDIAKSGVGAGVPKGAPKPDISTTEALKKTLMAAKSIGYSTGPSGVYMVSLFEKLGLADQVKDKLRQTPTGVFVGTIIASREVDIGFQQISELGNFPGVDYVGPLPADVQNTTVFSTGMIVDAKEAEAANALVKYLTSPEAGSAFQETWHGAGLTTLTSVWFALTPTQAFHTAVFVRLWGKADMRFCSASVCF